MKTDELIDWPARPIAPVGRLVRGCAAVAAVLVATSTHAGPPFVTDDPEPVEPRTWEVNFAVNGTRAQSGSAVFLPQVDVNYGLADGIQLHVQPQAVYSRSNGAESGGAGAQELEVNDRLLLAPVPASTSAASHAYGIGDTEVGLKLRLTPKSEHAEDWMISLYPLLELPTGNANRNLGAGASSMYLPIWIQTTRGDFTTYGGGGYWINHGTGSKNAWAGGWTALYQVTEKLQLGGEVFFKTADTVGQNGLRGFNLGGTLSLAPGYGLLFSAGRGLGNSAPSDELSFYIGLRFSF